MSTLITSLIDQAALNVFQPDKARITPAHWLTFYGAAARDIGARLFAVRYTSFADIQADIDYDYPDEMTRMIKLWTSETPDDVDSWAEVKELRDDELTDMVNRRYPTGTLPERYLAQATSFRVVPRPTAVLAGALKLEYWGLPDEITSSFGTQMQFPDFMREWVVEHMTISGLRALKQYVEAKARYDDWAARENDYAAKLTDRSDDRRPAFVPRSRKRSTGGMV